MMVKHALMAALLAVALVASPLSVRAAHHGEDGDDKVKDETEVKIKEDGTTYSLGSKWPITNGILGCLTVEEGVCTECLDPYFTLDGDVCVCTEGYGLAPFAYGSKAHKAKLMVCAPCPAGTYSDGGSYSTTLCERCPTGSTTPTPVSIEVGQCNICQSGFAGDPDQDIPCKLCPAGSYAEGPDATECTACDDGFTTPKAGSTEADQCYIAVCDVDQQSIKGKCYDCAEDWIAEKGSVFFGKYQPKCHKEAKPYNQKDITLKRGKAWSDEDGSLAEPKEHEPKVHVPDWDESYEAKGKGIVDDGDKEPKDDSKHDDKEEPVTKN